MKQKASETPSLPKPRTSLSRWPFALIVLGVLMCFGSVSIFNGFGLLLILCSSVPLVLQWREISRNKAAAEEVARAAAEKERAEAAAKAALEAEQKRRMEEEERQFQAEQAAMGETLAYQRLHTQVNELLDYARNLKQGSDDNKVLLEAMMDVVGRIATQHDLDKRYFEHEGIAADIRLFSEQLKRAGLQHDLVYQRAIRVLRYQPPEGTALRAVG